MHEHRVQFYEKDDFLLAEVSGFIGEGLRAGHAGLVIATRPHLDDLERRLKLRPASSDVDLPDPSDPSIADRYIALEAADLLSRFMVDGWPDERLFAEVLGSTIRRAAQDGSRRVHAFGEMVALLWTEGRHEAAIRLEELWNDLARSQSFALLCAYPMQGFDDAGHDSPFSRICEAHSHVRPAESFVGTTAPEELHRQVVRLQQKAAALEAEVARRKRSEEQLAERDRRKNEFLAMLGHELRNPLSVIVNSVQVMRFCGDDPVHLARSREMMARQAATMARLVDDLLDVSRATRGKIELRTAPARLDALVDQAVETVRPLIEEKGHRLTVDLPAGPVSLLCDATRLVQVLTNLLHNAAKYTDPGGNLALSAREEGPDLALRVRDDGAGMTPELCEQAFELFVQAPGSPEKAGGGLGIGLTLVRTLVALHGGSVEALSDGPGRGSELVVRLPLSAR